MMSGSTPPMWMNRSTSSVAMQHCNAESDDESRSVESEESFRCRSEESAAAYLHYAPKYEAGDLVWAKVNSHPWWPGQIFDVNFASQEARCSEKPGKVLVAFYGDHTFAWLDHAHILAFEPLFAEKVKAMNSQLFKNALSEALDEVSRRAQLGLECQCRRSEWEYNDANDEVERTPLRMHKDVSKSKDTLDVGRTLSFLKDLASSPCNPSSISSVYASVLCGHILGIRTRIAANKGSTDGILKDWRLAALSCCNDDMPEEAVISFSETADIGTSGVQSRIKRRKCGNVGNNEHVFPPESGEKTSTWPRFGGLKVDSEKKARASRFRTASGQRVQPRHGICGPTGSGDNTSNLQRNSLSYLHRDCLGHFEGEQTRGSSTSIYVPSTCQDDKATNSVVQISANLHDAAIDPLFYHEPSYNTRVTKMEAIFKFRDLVFEKSAGYGCHLECQDQEEMKMQDKPPYVGICAGGDEGSHLKPKVAQFCRPSAQKQRIICPHMNASENLELLDSRRAQPHPETLIPTKTYREGKKLSSERDRMGSGTSFEGVFQAHSQPQEMAFSPKLDVHDLLTEAHRKTYDITKETPVERSLHGQYPMEAWKRTSWFSKGAPSKLDVHELLVEAFKKKSVCAEEMVALKGLGSALKTCAMGGDSTEKVRNGVPSVSSCRKSLF